MKQVPMYSIILSIEDLRVISCGLQARIIGQQSRIRAVAINNFFNISLLETLVAECKHTAELRTRIENEISAIATAPTVERPDPEDYM